MSEGSSHFLAPMKLLLIVVTVFFGLLPPVISAEKNPPSRPAKAEHIILMVWDGMRPDFISPQFTPNLYQLAREGVFFKNHHALFVSSTEVNGTALATGVYPNKSGIMANTDYRPDIGFLQGTGTENLDAIRRGDLISGGKYLPVPTLPEILHQAGIPTIVAGTKAVAVLFDRFTQRTSAAASNSVMLHKGKTIPSTALPPIVKTNEKDFPPTVTQPNKDQDAWTTKALTHTLWRKGLPRLTILWLSDPDATQHETAPGSEASLTAIDNSDKNLGEVLKMLEEKKVRDKTDIFIVSDHGFSTVARPRNVVDILKRARFKAANKFDDPEPEDILVVNNGGSVSIYVMGQNPSTIERLVEFFQSSDFAGVIFSKVPIEGTFPFTHVRIDTTNYTPDLVITMRWTEDKNEYGTPGMIISDGGPKKGGGTHGSLSRFDMRNTLIGWGPDLRTGMINTLPSGNADLAPTILWLLGVKGPTMDGRVLHEALADGEAKKPAAPEPKTLTASRELDLFQWTQYLKTTTYDHVVYFDEGNGAASPR